MKRILRVSRFNGLSVVIIASLGGFISLLLGDLVGILVCVLAVVAGSMELRGNKKLRQRNAEGMAWLVRGESLLLAVILVYCATRLGSFDAETAMGNLTPDMEAPLKELGLERADILSMVRTTFFATYVSVSLVTLIYQGGMILYYRRRIALVNEALAAQPPAPPSRQPGN